MELMTASFSNLTSSPSCFVSEGFWNPFYWTYFEMLSAESTTVVEYSTSFICAWKREREKLPSPVVGNYLDLVTFVMGRSEGVVLIFFSFLFSFLVETLSCGVCDSLTHFLIGVGWIGPSLQINFCIQNYEEIQMHIPSLGLRNIYAMKLFLISLYPLRLKKAKTSRLNELFEAEFLAAHMTRQWRHDVTLLHLCFWFLKTVLGRQIVSSQNGVTQDK